MNHITALAILNNLKARIERQRNALRHSRKQLTRMEHTRIMEMYEREIDALTLAAIEIGVVMVARTTKEARAEQRAAHKRANGQLPPSA